MNANFAIATNNLSRRDEAPAEPARQVPHWRAQKYIIAELTAGAVQG